MSVKTPTKATKLEGEEGAAEEGAAEEKGRQLTDSAWHLASLVALSVSDAVPLGPARGLVDYIFVSGEKALCTTEVQGAD